jgi:hypothetical protein
MLDLKIFTESKADVKFLKDYIEEVFTIPLSDNNFDTLGSWSGYKAGGNLKASIEQNHKDDHKITILILDADTDFNSRREEILHDFSEYEVPINLFLFPNNNLAGTLETILCEIAIERSIINCFENYESCIVGYEAPVTKSKVFAYLDALLPEKHKKNDRNDLIQDKNRNYRNATHWNLNHVYLLPLREFLQSFIIP